MKVVYGLCSDVRRRWNRDKLSQDILGSLQVVLGDHQSFLDILDGVTLRHQALDLPVEGQISWTSGRRGRGGGGGAREVWQWSEKFPVCRSWPSVRVSSPGQGFRGAFGITPGGKQTWKHTHNLSY